MTFKTDTAIGAAYWASYLINGDDSGMTDKERRLADNWLARLPSGADVVDCGEPYFSWNYGFYTYADYQGGDLVEYSLLIRE